MSDCFLAQSFVNFLSLEITNFISSSKENIGYRWKTLKHVSQFFSCTWRSAFLKSFSLFLSTQNTNVFAGSLTAVFVTLYASNKVKIKLKFNLEHVTKAQRWITGIAPLFLRPRR